MKKKIGSVQQSFHSNFTAQSMDIGPGHRGAQRGKKIYEKGKSTDNKNERDTFLKKTGPQLPPLAKRKAKKKYG